MTSSAGTQGFRVEVQGACCQGTSAKWRESGVICRYLGFRVWGSSGLGLMLHGPLSCTWQSCWSRCCQAPKHSMLAQQPRLPCLPAEQCLISSLCVRCLGAGLLPHGRCCPLSPDANFLLHSEPSLGAALLQAATLGPLGPGLSRPCSRQLAPPPAISISQPSQPSPWPRPACLMASHDPGSHGIHCHDKQHHTLSRILEPLALTRPLMSPGTHHHSVPLMGTLSQPS